MNPYYEDASLTLYHGDALETMRDMPSASVNAVISDPPYAEVSRSYGRLTEAVWMELMQAVVRETRRVLTPEGSAVFILQPNFETLGRMRLWVWEFLVWAAKDWNLIQDVYWWNFTTMPGAGVRREIGLLRSSVKLCIWLGPPNCYRDQDAVLWTESDANRAQRMAYRAGESHSGVQPSGHSRDRGKMAGTAARRIYPSGHTKNLESFTRENGRLQRPSGWSIDEDTIDEDTIYSTFGASGLVTPFNLLPISNTDSQRSAGANGHGAGTPLPLCSWWIRYLTRPGDTVLDMFGGSGTVAEAAQKLGRKAVLIEKERDYCEMTVGRFADGRLSQKVLPCDRRADPRPRPGALPHAGLRLDDHAGGGGQDLGPRTLPAVRHDEERGHAAGALHRQGG